MDRILGRAAICAVLKRVSRGMYRAKLVPEGLQSLAVAISVFSVSSASVKPALVPTGFRVCQGKVESGFPDKTNENKEA